ncbi:MAG: type pilus assembly protein PilO [Candidatus Binatota bacterium]|jgi:type IV pilus assembly protein PilO|nr:type pilus assembly protein PilO [Candidatus Binatota bacterium]
MNDILERLFDLERNRRLIVYGVLLGVLALLYWTLSYSGNAQAISDRTARLEEVQTEVAKKQKMSARLAEYQQQVRDLDAALKKAVAQLPDQKEIPDLLSTVSSLGRESGLEIMLFRQRAEVYHDFYAEVPVEMLMRGSYHQVRAFLRSVGQLNRIVNVTDIAMRNAQVLPERVSLDTSCTAVTFRFLTEEERARIAAEKAARER